MSLYLYVVVEVELPGMGAQSHLVYLARQLVVEPGLDHVRSEDLAFEKEVVVARERGERLTERTGDVGDSLLLLTLQLIDVLVQRAGGLDLVLDPVQAGHEHRCESEIGVAGGVRRSELDSLLLRARGIDGDADA